ncbi:coatomer delta subunit, putative [Theileria equi strain WA]|uniref:Coatomer subunit delta n=1 Tax=Theileria equi strain WA TaxID=1537102 RepID=L0B277_THEEQ|nr:coatomer delta subunit, putative [Theileria equi strain WA]AFZ81234.1 coatomer delta subunit, putative [Theileria equi strain WA]|eukprot:XP_004830900.1 coatomer delta subunit, putative [Theileria equi strain WA]
MGILSTGLASDMRVLLSRQHVQISKAQIESSFSNFLRLIEKKDGDHTFVETDKNRFLYQSVDDFYVFIMTTLDSNVIEDLIVVKTLAEVIQNLVKPTMNEENIVNNIFDILFYMDELVSNGKRERLTYDQIKLYIDMDSHEEKMHNMIQDNKVKEEKERRKEIAAKLEKRKQLDHLFLDAQVQPVYSQPAAHVSPQLVHSQSPVHTSLYEQPKINLRANRGISSLNTLRSKEKEITKILDAEAPVVVQVLETCNGNLHLDGDVDVLNMQGEIVVTVFEEIAKSAALEMSDNPEIKFRYHPTVDKKLISKSKIEMQNELNLGQSLSIVKWRYKPSNEAFPLAVSCWPNTNAGETVVTIEINNISEIHFQSISFQILNSRFDDVTVNYNDGGEVNRNADSVNWVISNFEPNQISKFEFVTGGDLNNILPFTLFAQTPQSTSNIKITKCYNKSGGEDLVHVVKSQTSFSLTIGE